MISPFPMLAAKADPEKLVFPVLASPKIDGVRAVIHNGQALSRKLLPIPNQYLQGYFSNPAFQGLDGELVVGDPSDQLCIKHTVSGVMRIEETPDFAFYVFDKWDEHTGGFLFRHGRAQAVINSFGAGRVKLLPHIHIKDMHQLDDYEAEQLELGYEGVILRSLKGAYKHGRSTVREGGLLKMKRFEDSEALVIRVNEEMANNNEAERDNLGRTKRSTAKAGKAGKGRMGSLTVQDLENGWVFEVGTGFSEADRIEWWNWSISSTPSRRLIKYKYFPIGMQALPRHPVFLTRRDAMDM